MEKRGAFDYILLETTGLADPGNIAPLFWVDEGLGSSIYLDGVVTLIDAKNILLSLDEAPPPAPPSAANTSSSPAPKEETDEHHDHQASHLTTAHLQISHADVIVLNKTDLVTPAELDAVTERVRAINGLARIHVSRQSRVPALEGVVLDLHAYDDVGVEEVEGVFGGKGHSHLDPVSDSKKVVNGTKRFAR